MEFGKQRIDWVEKQAIRNAASFRPWEAPTYQSLPTPPPSPPSSEFAQMMMSEGKQPLCLAESEHRIVRVEVNEGTSQVCSGVQETILQMQSHSISDTQTQPMDLSTIRVANRFPGHAIRPVIKQGPEGSCFEYNGPGLGGFPAPTHVDSQQINQGFTGPATQRPSCIIFKSTPGPADSAMMVKHAGIVQTITSTAMRARTASSHPVPLVTMFLKGSRQGEATRIHITPDMGASSTVVSAHTAKVLLLQIDQSRKVNLEDAQGNQLEVSGIASVYGCLEIAQDFWGTFEVIVSPALSTGVLLSHMEQKILVCFMPSGPTSVCTISRVPSKTGCTVMTKTSLKPTCFRKTTNMAAGGASRHPLTTCPRNSACKSTPVQEAPSCRPTRPPASHPC